MSELLISAKELKHELHQPDVVIFDVRHDLMDHRLGRQQYNQSHIPGAYFLDNEAELVGTPTGDNGRHPLPNLADFVALLKQYGVKESSQVIVYDAQQSVMAARAWWMIRWAGHQQVRILDGGFQAWLDAGGVTDTHIELPAVPFSRHVTEQTPALKTVTADQIQAQFAQNNYVLIDARAPERFAGLAEPIDPIAGHIPGAINRFNALNLNANGTFKSPELLRKEFMALLGPASNKQIVHYCGSGISACHNYFAMELAGISDSCLYPGSWSEWIANPSRPIATAE